MYKKVAYYSPCKLHFILHIVRCWIIRLSEPSDRKLTNPSCVCIECLYVTASNLIVFWLNGSRIISTNRRVYVDRHRVSIEGHGDTYNLRVQDVQQQDDGEYSCQVPGPHTITQTSRVIVSSKFF